MRFLYFKCNSFNSAVTLFAVPNLNLPKPRRLPPVIGSTTPLQHSVRWFSSKFIPNCKQSGLSHVDGDGKASMVDVSVKKSTMREAVAVGTVALSNEAFTAIVENNIKKGDVLSIAQIAGIMGGKKTSQLIPLCHPILLSKLDVCLTLNPDSCSIQIKSWAKTNSNTGVEMEALAAVSIAALTVYDMCKAIDKGIIIKEINLLSKTGGKSDYIKKE